MVYGPDGQRIIRKTPTGTTLYLGGMTEIHRTTAGTKTATRYYQFAGNTIAMRTYSDVRFLLADHQASTTATASAYTTSIDYQQYLPYGDQTGRKVPQSGIWKPTNGAKEIAVSQGDTFPPAGGEGTDYRPVRPTK